MVSMSHHPCCAVACQGWFRWLCCERVAACGVTHAEHRVVLCQCRLGSKAAQVGGCSTAQGEGLELLLGIPARSAAAAAVALAAQVGHFTPEWLLSLCGSCCWEAFEEEGEGGGTAADQATVARGNRGEERHGAAVAVDWPCQWRRWSSRRGAENTQNSRGLFGTLPILLVCGR